MHKYLNINGLVDQNNKVHFGPIEYVKTLRETQLQDSSEIQQPMKTEKVSEPFSQKKSIEIGNHLTFDGSILQGDRLT